MIHICDECAERLHSGEFTNFCPECLESWEEHEQRKMDHTGLDDAHLETLKRYLAEEKTE